MRIENWKFAKINQMQKLKDLGNVFGRKVNAKSESTLG